MHRAVTDRIDVVRRDLTTLLNRLKAEGHGIARFEAPAKATTLMCHFGIGPDIVDFIVDDSPLKQNLFSPGPHIPIVSSRAIHEHRPDYLFLLAWNFAGPIMAKHQAFSAGGGNLSLRCPMSRSVDSAIDCQKNRPRGVRLTVR